MCVILIGTVNKELHEAAKKQNPDGFSLFTAEAGLIKAPTKAQVEKNLNKFGIWHYRIGTSGTINKADKTNIHPFRICKGKYYFYHNGVLGEGIGQLSDTHALANTLYDVTLKTARSVLRALSERQRFVIVSATDPTKFELFGNWSAEKGVLMSHKLYQYTYDNKKFSFGGK